MPQWKKDAARRMRDNPTGAEARLHGALSRQKLGARFKPQVTAYGYILDFYCAKHFLVVEVDGPYHQHRAAEDDKRDAILASHGLTTLRFSNDEVLNDLSGVLRRIRAAFRPDVPVRFGRSGWIVVSGEQQA